MVLLNTHKLIRAGLTTRVGAGMYDITYTIYEAESDTCLHNLQSGQAWAILGFSQTYRWTRNPIFRQAAISLADYFVKRLKQTTHEFPFVPVWDWDAPVPATGQPLRDASAGMWNR